MAEIHRMLQHSFDEAIGLVGGVSEGDISHAKVVATQLNLISIALRAHHEGEDSRLWDMIGQRAPACFLHVERMKAQHAAMAVHLEDLDRAVPAWSASATAESAVPVRTALEGISAALAQHFPDEEASIVPVIEHVLTEREQDWFGKHGRRAVPRGQAWNTLGAILVAQPDGGTEWLRRNMPPPGRLAWRLIGAPRYARFRAALEGAVPSAVPSGPVTG